MKKFIGLFLLILLCACTFQTKHRGYIFPENMEAEVTEMKTTAQLRDRLGSPLAKTVYGNEVWIYYGTEEDYHGPFPLTYEEKTVLLVWTDNSGRISQTKVLRGKDLPKVKVADGETEIPAAIELNAIQELFNNIGRFTPAGIGS